MSEIMEEAERCRSDGFPSKIEEDETQSEEIMKRGEDISGTDVNNTQKLSNSADLENFICSIPYEEELFSHDDFQKCNFGLIRGHHKDLHDCQSQDRFLCCQAIDEQRLICIKRRHTPYSYQVCGIVCGAVFLFLGLFSLFATYFFASNGTREDLWGSLDISSIYIHAVAIFGLSAMAIGAAIVSLCLLVPFVVGRFHGNAGSSWFCRGDLYVKNVQDMSPSQFLYFDCPLVGEFMGNTDVKKVQPSAEDKE